MLELGLGMEVVLGEDLPVGQQALDRHRLAGVAIEGTLRTLERIAIEGRHHRRHAQRVVRGRRPRAASLARVSGLAW